MGGIGRRSRIQSLSIQATRSASVVSRGRSFKLRGTFINELLYEFLRPIVSLTIQPETFCPSEVTLQHGVQNGTYSLCVLLRTKLAESFQDSTDEGCVVVGVWWGLFPVIESEMLVERERSILPLRVSKRVES